MNKFSFHSALLNKRLLSVQLCKALLTLIGLFSIATVQAQVVSMSKITEVLTDNGSYRQFSVNCGARIDNRFLRKDSDSALWCDAIVGTYCARKRLKAAEIVCSRRYTSALKKLSENVDPSSQSNQADTATNVTTDAKPATAPPIQAEEETVQAEPSNADAAIKSTESSGLAEKRQDKPAASSEGAGSPQSREALEQELQEIESKLIDIQAQKLDLRAKDLQLMKNQLNQTQ